MKAIKVFAGLLLMSTLTFGQLFINEIDYDQVGVDAGEFVELAGPAGTYSNVTLEHYNGNGGALIWTYDLPTFTLADESNGFGFYVFGVSGVPNVDFEFSGSIQNGAPDGMVLKVNGSIVDAVAWEGEMNDPDGNPMESFEGDFAGVDSSASRLGMDGSPWVYGPFSPGAVNVGQTFDPNTNYPPVANAGADQNVEIGATVTLDGSGSTDDGTISGYAWTQTAGPTVTLSNASSAVASFVVPNVAATTTWTFMLTVTDDEAATGTDEVSVTTTVTAGLADLAALRASAEGGTYTINGEVVLTWTQSFRGQKYVQDGSAAILIDDYDGIITTAYEVGDGITGLTGVLGSYGNMLQFVPVSDPGPASSTDNSINPETVTLAELSSNFEAYEGELILVENVSFTGADGSATFANGTTYPITDATGSFTFRTTFYSVDYIGTVIPQTTNMIGIPNSRSEGDFISSRDMADLDYRGVAPTFENATHSPEFVTSANEITIAIDIVPGDETQSISSAVIMYGNDGTLLNESEMWLDNGNTWMGIIPAQAANSFLQYEVIATTNDDVEFDSWTYNLAIASPNLTTIASIQADPVIGNVVTIEGVITIGGDLLQPPYTKAYIQDASGRGINLFDFDELDINRGDRIKAVGVVDIYNAVVQVTDFSYQLLSTGNDLPAPVTLTPGEANDLEWEGTFLKITGTITDTWSAGGGQNILVGDGSDTCMVRIWESTGVDVTPLTIGTEWSFMGIESQYNGVFQMLVAYDEDIVSTSEIHVVDTKPASFALNPAYPNPFNPSTTISWKLESASDMQLKVLDVRGREVALLATGHSGPGQFSMTWEAADLSSGVYFVQLVTPEATAIQKVMLLK